eukprot:8843-Pelagomonas_calceolata.AAC.2
MSRAPWHASSPPWPDHGRSPHTAAHPGVTVRVKIAWGPVFLEMVIKVSKHGVGLNMPGSGSVELHSNGVRASKVAPACRHHWQHSRMCVQNTSTRTHTHTRSRTHTLMQASTRSPYLVANF